MKVNCGVPQGSILEPTLSNVIEDGVLNIQLTNDATPFAPADDLSLVVEAGDEEEFRYRIKESINRITK